MSRAAESSVPEVPVDEPIARRLDLAVAHYGEPEFVERAVALLSGANAGEEFLLWVGGRHAQGVLDGAPPLYWPEVWGARALNYGWDDSAAPVVVAAMGNVAWRLREMCAKVAATRGIAALPELTGLLADEVPRVRAAAARALAEVGDFDQALKVKELLGDPDVDVRRSAGASVVRLRERLDRPID